MTTSVPPNEQPLTDTAEAARLVDRATGALYGVALGDAMGMPSELWPRAQVREHFGEITGFLPGPPGHFIVDGFAAGQVTDDTQQTVMLAEAIIASDGQLDGELVGRHLVAWAERTAALEAGNFLGPSSARAIKALQAGVPAAEAGRRGDTNGAAMRIVPVGILCPSGDMGALVDQVEAACLPSHATNIAIAGASMIAAAVAAAIDGADLEHVLACSLRACDAGMDRGNRLPGASLRRRTEWALERVATGGPVQDVLDDLYDIVGSGVATTEAVPTALALVRLAQGEPLRAALLAANLGGDTDTIGAMCGGVCGAYQGVSGIPESHRTTLERVNELDLAPLARRLAELRMRRGREAA